MLYKTLITAQDLAQNLHRPDWVLFDCRFSLSDSQYGSRQYRRGHLPTARYADLNEDLSAPLTSNTGRHPLPDFLVLAQKLGAWGVSQHSQVVVYDDQAGAFAGRLWWLLRCMGLESVAVLDGGMQSWQNAGYGLTTHLPRPQAVTFRTYLNTPSWLNALQVENGIASKTWRLIDARSPERYSGKHEPIDRVAGHIPSACNRPFSHNLVQGLFRPAAQLRSEFAALMGAYRPEQVVHYCGSGVSACHNVLAMEYAGLHGSKLYAGAWSEWLVNKNRAIVSRG